MRYLRRGFSMALLAILAMARPVWAHPGHHGHYGSLGEAVHHVLTSPFHLMVISFAALVLVVALTVAFLGRAGKVRRDPVDRRV